MINIINENDYQIDNDEIISYCSYLQQSLNDECDFTIVFIDSEYMLNLNSEFRNKDYATDVLTFCEEDDSDYLGDIIINHDIILEQATKYNHSFKRELYFLITHGYLHLHNYDHQTKVEEEKMFSLQEKLLADYDIRRS